MSNENDVAVDVGSEAVTPGPILIPEVAPEVETPAPILADAFEPVAQVSEPEQVTAWPFDHAFPTGTPVAAHVPPTEVPADVQLHPEGDPLFHAGSPTGKAS